MPALLIPGFYFDETKKKYFKVQANHAAPEGSKYSRVSLQKEAEDEMVSLALNYGFAVACPVNCAFLCFVMEKALFNVPMHDFGPCQCITVNDLCFSDVFNFEQKLFYVRKYLFLVYRYV